MQLIVQFLILVFGFFMLVKGADWFVEGSSNIAIRFHIPQLVIGLTIVAMGTSAPETAVSITASLRNNGGIAIGNVVGSNILNILVILGVTAIITSIKVQQSTIRVEIPFMIVITIVLYLTGITNYMVTFIEGGILLALFAMYLFYLYGMAKQGTAQSVTPINNTPLWQMVIFAILGIICIILGSNVTVNAVIYIARFLGVSERFIGLTIVAFGTSLPEMVTSIMAATKGKADIAIGNIVGSNIFNILFVIGTTALITPVTFEANFLKDTVIAILAGALLWVIIAKKQQLTRIWGIIMLASYFAYIVYLL